MLWLRGKPNGKLPGFVKWKDAKAALTKQAPHRGRNSAATAHLTAPKEQRPGPSAEQMDLGDVWNHVVRGRRVLKATTYQPLFQIPLPSLSWKLSRSLKWPRPGRRPGLRSLSTKPQQPISWLLEILKRKQPRVSKPRPLNPLPPTGWSQTKVPPPHSRKFLISSITFPSMHVWSWLVGFSHQSSTFPQGQPHSGCPEYPHSLCGRIWQHALGVRSELKPCASPAGTRTSAWQEEWTGAFSQPARCRYLSLKWDILQQLSSLPACQLCLPPHRQTNIRGRCSYPGPQWYSSLLSAYSVPDPLGGYSHPGYNGQQTGKNPCGLPLPFPPTDRSGPVRLFRRGNAGLDGRRPQRQTRGLELAADHKTGETPAWLCRRELLSDLWSGYPNH